MEKKLTNLPPLTDSELMADLAAVDAEIVRRKKLVPFEPYALWAMNARQMALARFEMRINAITQNSPTAQP